MRSNKRKQDIMMDALKELRSHCRNEEIALYRHSICWFHMEENKKKYKRHQKHRKNESLGDQN